MLNMEGKLGIHLRLKVVAPHNSTEPRPGLGQNAGED
jgi:hypothetical protein